MSEIEQKLKTAKKGFRARLLVSVCGGLFLFALVLPFVYLTHSLSFHITPQLAANNGSVAISDGLGWVLFDSAYILGRRATVRFESPGFISETVPIAFPNDTKLLLVEMQEAPVSVVITTEPPLPKTRWHLNGVHVATAERFAQTMQPGSATIQVNNPFYQPQVLAIEVQVGKDFAHHLSLKPLIGKLNIDSEPAGAMVVVNGENKGITPIEIAVSGGLYRSQIILAGYGNIEEEITITNSASQAKRNYRLKLSRNTVPIKATPSGGVLQVNGVAINIADSLSLALGKKYILQYEKPGYFTQAQEVLPKANQPIAISFQLAKEIGEVVIRSTPSAELAINGKASGTTPQTLQLQAVPQKITLSRSGYRTVQRVVTPSALAPLLIDQQLNSEADARLSEATPFLTAAADIKMKFFEPLRLAKTGQAKNRFTMGSPNNEKFRRANEFQRQVELTKPFYVSVNETTEQQFAKYKPMQIAGKNLPIRNVSWLEAARFCNWLSRQDGLQPAYQFAGEQLQNFAATDGYRLLFEAEWEWLARVVGRAETARFVWGNGSTIPPNSGNFADLSAKGSVPKYIPRYNDRFANVAPVASFAADAAGLYDMVGNVSEWMHDIYDLQPPIVGQVERDPIGGRHGDGRVIKGASFRSASITELRSSFREGLLRRRDDVGFRVARYLYRQD